MLLGRRIAAFAGVTWFIWAVASQSVAVLAAVLQPAAATGRRELALLAVFAWSVGIFLYAAQGIFVAARLLLTITAAVMLVHLVRTLLWRPAPPP